MTQVDDADSSEAHSGTRPITATAKGRMRLGVAEVALGVLTGTASSCAGMLALFELIVPAGDATSAALDPTIAIPMLVGSVFGLLGGTLLALIGWRLVRRELG
jgi:hypothetical protein